MNDFLSNTLGSEVANVFSVILSLAIVLLLILFVLYLARQIIGPRIANNGPALAKRLQVMDAASVDGKRRVVLIRRDNIEHLVMIGGPNDLVIEPRIVMSANPRARTGAGSIQQPPAQQQSGVNLRQTANQDVKHGGATNVLSSKAAGMMAGAASISSAALNKVSRPNKAPVSTEAQQAAANAQTSNIQAQELSPEEITQMVQNQQLPLESEQSLEADLGDDTNDIQLDMSDFEQSIAEGLSNEAETAPDAPTPVAPAQDAPTPDAPAQEKSAIEDEMDELLSELASEPKT